MIRMHLERYFDDADPGALDEACRTAAREPLDIAGLLEWVRQAPAEARLKDQALRALRAALRLPAMPGPVCRPHRL